MENHTVRSAYSKKSPVRLNFNGTSRTKQSFKDETDINAIMARFQKTGMLEFVNKHEPQYGDVTALDFQISMESVATAREMFADLPSKVRDRFNNEPAELLEFLDNPDNRDEAVLLGLVTLPKAKTESKPPATPEARRRRNSDAPEAKPKVEAKPKTKPVTDDKTG